MVKGFPFCLRGILFMGARERWKFFKTCSKICKYSALPIAAISLFLVVLIAYDILSPSQSFLPKPFSLVVGFFIGILNILTGLLLLTKE
jgi:hypothetical protein